jgi:hypothetical protein
MRMQRTCPGNPADSYTTIERLLSCKRQDLRTRHTVTVRKHLQLGVLVTLRLGLLHLNLIVIHVDHMEVPHPECWTEHRTRVWLRMRRLRPG